MTFKNAVYSYIQIVSVLSKGKRQKICETYALYFLFSNTKKFKENHEHMISIVIRFQIKYSRSNARQQTHHVSNKIIIEYHYLYKKSKIL